MNGFFATPECLVNKRGAEATGCTFATNQMRSWSRKCETQRGIPDMQQSHCAARCAAGLSEMYHLSTEDTTVPQARVGFIRRGMAR